MARKYYPGTALSQTSGKIEKVDGLRFASVDGEAVEQARSARAHQIILAAAPARVRRVPRSVARATAVGMAELRGACAVACPVVTSVVGAVRKSPAIGLRACQHVVRVGSIPPAIDHVALLG